MADRLTARDRLDKLSVPVTAFPDAGSVLERARTGVASEQFREFWKYTPTAAFIEALEDVARSTPDVTGVDQPGVSMEVQSLASTDLASLQDTASAERFPLADVALLMAGEVLVIDVEGSPEHPICIDYLPGLSTPVVLRIASGAAVRLLERADADAFLNHSLYVHVGSEARLEHAFTGLSTGSPHWAMTQVALASASQYRRQQYQVGGSRRRSETQILLNGPEATAEITGAYVVEGGTHLDQQIILEHRARDTRSRQRFHGIGAGKGTAVFNGRIHIHENSPRSDAALSNRNLALHPEAVINTKPELEIYTDDVRCAHGATVGQISEESLFYLRSRGLTSSAARRMLCRAFIGECIEGDLAEAAEAVLLGNWTSA